VTDKPKKTKRNKKDSQLLIRISLEERENFLQICEDLDTTAAREIRHFIRGFVAQNARGESHTVKESIHVEEGQTVR